MLTINVEIDALPNRPSQTGWEIELAIDRRTLSCVKRQSVLRANEHCKSQISSVFRTGIMSGIAAKQRHRVNGLAIESRSLSFRVKHGDR